jgi:hypothetical protein
MGGLAARAWLRAGRTRPVHHVVTIGAPTTWHLAGADQPVAQWPPDGAGQRVAAHNWMRTSPRRPQPPFTCWYSNCDNVVFPSSTATLAGADNRLVAGMAHVELGFHPPRDG